MICSIAEHATFTCQLDLVEMKPQVNVAVGELDAPYQLQESDVLVVLLHVFVGYLGSQRTTRYPFLFRSKANRYGRYDDIYKNQQRIPQLDMKELNLI